MKNGSAVGVLEVPGRNGGAEASHDSAVDLVVGEYRSDADHEMANYANEMLPTGEEAADFDIDADLGDEYDEHLITEDLPTTHCSAEALEFDTTIGTIGTSVFLNKCGTLLVRKDNAVRASRRERNLIERIVSAPTVGTVPLVYLESVLFPSIFWCLPELMSFLQVVAGTDLFLE